MSLLYLLLLLILGAVLEHLSKKHCLDRLGYELKLSKNAVECGEEFVMTSVVSNGKLFPVTFLRLTENVPRQLETDLDGSGAQRKTKHVIGMGDAAYLDQTLYIMPRRKAERSIKASLPARGRYLFRGASLTAGDLLGLSEESMDVNSLSEVIVYPPKAGAAAVDNAFGNYLGDVSVRRYILSDPILTVGFREYSGREPQRDISWPRSLREGSLMVKQYDYTSELTATVLLNICGGTPEQIERCYSLARGVCESLEEMRVSYDFLTNACASGAAGMWSYIGDGLGSKHLYTILEGLARAMYEPVFGFERLLNTASRGHDSSRAFILVTPKKTAELTDTVSRFESRVGQRVLIVEAGEEEC